MCGKDLPGHVSVSVSDSAPKENNSEMLDKSGSEKSAVSCL